MLDIVTQSSSIKCRHYFMTNVVWILFVCHYPENAPLKFMYWTCREGSTFHVRVDF